jgi:hypothetical protein
VVDLVPELHHHRTPRDMFFQLSLMTLGLSVVSIAKALEHLGAS